MKRYMVRSRSGGWCERCRHRGRWVRASEVHHLRYPQRLGTEPLSWLVDLCGTCHDRAHGRGSRVTVMRCVWAMVVLLGVWWVVMG
jgi:hypothetical protein